MKASLIFSLPFLAASALASPLELNGRAISSTDRTNLDFYAQYAGISYCNSDNAVGKLVTCTNSACPTPQTNKAVTLRSFRGAVTDIRGLVVADHVKKVIVVSFRGSASIRNWIVDFVFVQTPCSDLVSGCLAHSGFYASWKEVQSTVLAAVKAAKASYPSYQVVATGHSLGGAVATLGAAYIRKAGIPVHLYTYGAPRVGNNALASFVTSQIGVEARVTNRRDPVPRLPPIILNFRHTSPEYWISGTSSAAADITYCSGFANVNCNGGTLGLAFAHHGSYFREIAACSPGGLPWKRDMTDAELERKLNEYVELDIQLAHNLEGEN